MKRPKNTVLLLGLVTFAFTAAQASVYSQALNLNNDGGPTSFPLEQVADAFQLSSATSLSTLTWYGDNPSNAFPSTVKFTINLYADAGGLAANSTFSSQSVIASVVDTGISEPDCCFGIAEIFQFSANLLSPVGLNAGTTYWISILDASGSPTNSTFRWANGTTTWPGDVANACCFPGSWSNVPPPRQQAAYALNPVPEPGSLALLGSGVAGIAAALRRKRML